MIHVIVSYDVSTQDAAGKRRLRRIARACVDYGARVQYSIFECHLSGTDWARLKIRLLREMSKDDDSLRFYYLCESDLPKTEHHGQRKPMDFSAPLVL